MKIRTGIKLGNKDGKKGEIVIKKLVVDKPYKLIIGGILIMVGCAFTAYQLFMSGAHSYDLAEFNTMVELGIINPTNDLKRD